ncbi:Ger(x)C family spore germination protein [Paenibacillus endoradicis]|uniref:Ger(x)C family spore germination protein n=1 Tax=Paenibacillus endoradicis TaxID=2972487 RepID=UPI002159A3FB|nr:Ger(x)C family spore germination protein [Paenibacillus endoradicis]MCR8657978.1 Ger(x)C family spore germination protein [Paenibacillus endoradicis]
MRKKLLLSTIFLNIIFILLLSGCGFKDIDKRYFVVGTGIDYSGDDEKPFRITIKLAVPSVSIDPGNSKTQIEAINSATIAEGVRMLKAQVDKEIDFGHCNVFLIGEELANRNIQDIVYWMSRRRDIQNIAALGVGTPSAEEVISKQPTVERFPGNSLNLFFSNDATESSFTYVELLTDLFRRVNEKGLDPILPMVEIQNDTTYVVNRVALLNKEKITLILNPEETQLFNQISGHLAITNVYGSFPNPPYVVAISSIKTKYSIPNEEQPTVNMNIKQAVTFEEEPVNETSEDQHKVLIDLQNAYSEKTQQLLVKIQEAGVDPLGFGLRYRAEYDLADFDENWPDIYKSMKFKVNTKMITRGSGLLR